jgi:hypothetical protein
VRVTVPVGDDVALGAAVKEETAVIKGVERLEGGFEMNLIRTVKNRNIARQNKTRVKIWRGDSFLTTGAMIMDQEVIASSSVRMVSARSG